MPAVDCVVVGYNDIDFDGLLQRMERAKAYSGGYRHLLVNSLFFRGRRVKYPDLLNGAVESATGRPSRLHVAQMPNLGVCYLVSFLRKKGLQAELVNFFNADRDHFRALLAERPRSVAITTTFYFEPQPVREIVDFVRMHSPSTQVVVGGPHVFNVCTDHPPIVQDGLLKDMAADIYVFDSQGELTLSRVCHELREVTPDLSNIPNLIYTSDNRTFRRTSRVIESNDMDECRVDWSVFDPGFLAPTVQTRTARSCAFKCAFCRYPVVAGGLDLQSIDAIEADLQYLHSIGVRQLLFIDDTFNVPLPRFKQLCRTMIRNKFDFRWFSYFRCSNSDDETFDLMAEAGCAGVFLGIESGDDRVLKAMNKAASAERYAYGIERLHAHGVLSFASFIVGHPGETEETARNTLAFIERTRPSFYCLETFFYDHKTPIGAKAAEYGLKGSAYAWTHGTMDWRTASGLVEEGYKRIRGSVVLPLYGFDLWSIAYLMGKGVRLDQIKDFLGVASRMLVEGLDGPSSGYERYEQRVVDIFREPAVTASPLGV